MSTIYEVNSPSLGQLQVIKDMIFGWCIRTVEPGLSFKAVSDLDLAELDYLKMIRWPAYIPEEFSQKIREVHSERQKSVQMSTQNTEGALKPVQVAPKSVKPASDPIADSHRQISLDILTKAKVVEGVLTADLGYAIYRGGYVNGQCTVESVSVRKGELTSFKNAKEAVAHIARKWW